MRAILELLMRAIEELRDPWALAFAAASAYAAYLFGGHDWQIVAVAVAVLAVRVAAGLLLPLAPVPPAPRLTSEEYVIARRSVEAATISRVTSAHRLPSHSPDTGTNGRSSGERSRVRV
ncbi:MAG: hypothetical protein E6I19_08120 [Chloroflexi bacterium]|nr:MAG: hypothetical protein E6I19_08120 [Chloroflexota bacterium]